MVTFLIAASGVSILGIGSAFWALLVGLIVRAVLQGTHPALTRATVLTTVEAVSTAQTPPVDQRVSRSLARPDAGGTTTITTATSTT